MDKLEAPKELPKPDKVYNFEAKSSFLDKITNLLTYCDMFSRYYSLSYHRKLYYTTFFSRLFSLLLIMYSVFYFLDNTLIVNQKISCTNRNGIPIKMDEFSMSKEELAIQFGVYDNLYNKYNEMIHKYLNVTLHFSSQINDPKTNKYSYSTSDAYLFILCKSRLENTLKNSSHIMCLNDDIIEYPYQLNFLNTDLVLRLRNKDNIITDLVKPQEYFSDKAFKLYIISKSFNQETIEFVNKPFAVNFTFSTFNLLQRQINNTVPIFYIYLKMDTYSYYNKWGYLIESNVYSVDRAYFDFSKKKPLINVSTDLLNIRFIFPTLSVYHFSQNHDYILSTGLVGGWTFILYGILGQIIVKITRIKMNESLCNESFYMLNPNEKYKIDNLNKDTQEQFECKFHYY